MPKPIENNDNAKDFWGHLADASALSSDTKALIRGLLSLGTLATQSGTFSGTSSGTNTGDQDLSGYLPLAGGTMTGGLNMGGYNLGAVNIIHPQVIMTPNGVDLMTVPNETGTFASQAYAESLVIGLVDAHGTLALGDFSSITGTIAIANIDGLGTAATTDASAYATAAQGTDERVPTAAGLTSKFATADATMLDADRVAIFDSTASFAPKHGLASVIWTYIKSKIDAGMTLAGVHAFSSTTRPTSAGTGTPAATSLITRADGDARYAVPSAKLSTTQQTANSFTLADVTGLTGFDLEANTNYRLEFFGEATCDNVNTGLRLAMIASSALALVNQSNQVYQPGLFQVGNGSSPIAWWFIDGSGLSILSRAAATTTRAHFMGMGYFKSGGSAGTMKIQFSHNNTAGTVTLHAGVCVVLTKLA